MADRPPWLERLAILIGCAVLFVAIAKMDSSAHKRETARALAVIAQREAADERRFGHFRDAADTIVVAGAVRVAPRRAPDPQRMPMIWLVALGGAGIVMAGTGARLLIRG